MKPTALILFLPRIVAITVLLFFATACSKEIIDESPEEEIASSASSPKLNSNGCALITGAVGSTYEFVGAPWIIYSISWTNQGGKKFIKVFPEGGVSFFIDASASSGLYSWSQPVTSLYGIFTIRAITYTGRLPGEGTICQDQTWSIAIDPIN